jgi:hydrogenase maturation protease
MKALVIGVGHPFRRDDSIGPRLAETLSADIPLGVAVTTHHGEGTGLMECWAGYDRVIVADATCSGTAPGCVRTWDAVSTPLPAGLFPKGSHLFGVAEGIELARRLGRLPSRLDVVGVEGKDFSAGEGLSPEVEAALPLALVEIRRLLPSAAG